MGWHRKHHEEVVWQWKVISNWFFKYGNGNEKCLDIPAGCGRITKDLLSYFYKYCEMLELTGELQEQNGTWPKLK